MALLEYGSGANLHRHEFDLLEPTPGFDAGPARAAELPGLTAFAKSAIPGIQVSVEAVCRVSAHNPEAIYVFRRSGRIVGGIAYLFLNDIGLERLILDEIDFSSPDLEILAGPGTAPAAIYIWACAAKGRAAAGLGTPASRLREAPYAHANYYAQARTEEGARFMRQISFEPTPSFQKDLWIYRRRINRSPETAARPQPTYLQYAA